MYTIRKTFKFEASHRLMSSFSKCCQTIHGHSYKVELFISTDEFNADGMVIDFGEVKDWVMPLINSWDHSLILHEKDPIIKKKMLGRQYKIAKVKFNPTAEHMAEYIYGYVFNIMPSRIDNIKVRVHETDTGWAEYFE